MNEDRTTNPPSNSGPHLSDETLSEFASGRLNGNDRAAARRHAETCPQCAQALRDYTAMTAALHDLPAPRPNRTFQMTEAQARSHAKPRRWALSWLVPSLPALRAVTVAVALLLLVVAEADRLTEPGGKSPDGQRFAAVIVPSATASATLPALVKAAVIAPANQTADSSSGRVDAGSEQTTSPAYEAPTDASLNEAGAPAPAAAASDSESGSADSATGAAGSAPNRAVVANVAASPTLAATPAPTVTPTATTAPTPEPTATPVAAAPASTGGSSRTGWRIAELGLGLLLLWLIVSYAGLRRTARDRSS